MVLHGCFRAFRSLVHSLVDYGWAETGRRILRRLTAGRLLPAEFTEATAPHPFDLQYGTETSGFLAGGSMHSGNTRADFCNTAYYGISPSTLRAALLRLPESPADFTFVDLGCGKGRALHIAAMHGFRSVLGVELSAELCEVARRNLSGFANAAVLQGDAAKVAYPAGSLVVYLYHPFLAPLLRRVLQNLRQQLTVTPRTCYLLQANPRYPKVLARHGATAVWQDVFALSPEDALADRHGITEESYELSRISD